MAVLGAFLRRAGVLGPPAELYSDGLEMRSFAWSRDGSAIAYGHNDPFDGSESLRVAAVRVQDDRAVVGAPAELYRDGLNERSFSWSPAGSAIVYRHQEKLRGADSCRVVAIRVDNGTVVVGPITKLFR